MADQLKLIQLSSVILVIVHMSNASRFRFTDIVCNITDPTYSRVDRCSLVVESKSVQYFTAHLTPLELPITEFSMRIQLMRNQNGWKPFMFEQTIGCNFTHNLNTMTRTAWNLVKTLSNVNHDCPFNQSFDLPRLENTALKEIIKVLPVPLGVYGVFATIKTKNITRGIVSFHGVLE